MTFGVNDLINCINQAATRSNLTALEILQLTGSECQLNDKCTVFSVACQASLPTASCNTGRFVYVTNESKYYFSTGAAWTSDVSGITSAVWSWGNNSDGQLGDNTTVNKSSPVSVVGIFTDWCQVSSGLCHSLAVRSNGTARAWGNNTCGRLGDNTTENKSSPVSVVGGFTDWCQVSAGREHSLGVRTNSTAWAWGCGGSGRLGNNSTTNRTSPVSIIAFSDWSRVSAGGFHSLGLRTNGTIWAWGFNDCGQLGNNSTSSTSSPVSVVGGFTDWCQLSTGFKHSLAIRTGGTAWAWGNNYYGQLGDGYSGAGYTRSSPVSVIGGFTNWCQLSGGYMFSLGVRQNGTAWGWGRGASGQLGNNSAIGSQPSPVSVVGGFTDWCKISAGSTHSLGLRQNGTLWSWGNGDSLGNNCTTNRSSPVSVVGGYTDWWDVSGGGNSSLAIRKSCGF